MKIVSKFHDYYDCMMRNGVDSSCVYDRKTEEFHKDDSKFSKYFIDYYDREYSYALNNFRSLNVTHEVVGFCGKLYPLIVCDYDQYFYSMEEIIPFIDDNMKNGGLKDDKWRPIKDTCRIWFEELKSVYCLPNYHRKYNNLEEIFQKHKVPVFHVRKNMIVFNPSLKALKFFKVMEPYQTYQSIYQYLTNELAENKDMKILPVKEKDRLIGHGFDPKWSFRKEPK